MKLIISKNILFVIPIISMLSLSIDADARGIEVMKDPVELFYAEPGKITKSQANKMVIEALQRSNRPRWTHRSGKKGVMRAEAEKGRLYAAIDIYVDKEGIKINYVDSEKMRFRERRDKKYIRDTYNKWVKSLTKELKRSAQYKYKLKLVSAKNKKILKGIAAGKELVVIAVRALPDVKPKRNGPKWSAQIAESLVDALNSKYGAKHVYSALEWSRDTQRYVKGGYKASYNRLACDANEANGVITVGVEIDSTDTDSNAASQEMTITYFNCDSEKLIARTVDGDYTNGDTFDLQTATKIHVGKILNEAGF